MNINRINYAQEIYQGGVRKPAGAAKKLGLKRDEINISSEGRILDMAKKAVAALPDLREERVSQLAKRIENGSYSVSAASVARLLLD